jgi:hypothetical protein
MKREPNLEVERYRQVHPILGGGEPGMNFGYFVIPIPFCAGGGLRVISSGCCADPKKDGNWEHVSVSLPNRCPTWEEMKFTKELFRTDNETVLQFHPRKSEYVNNHEFTLHLWRQNGKNHPLPERRLIGI